VTLPDRLRILSHGAANDTVAADILAIADQFDTLEQRHAAALEVLRSLEWCDSGNCPCCSGDEPGTTLGWLEGHKKDCKLALVLSQPTAVASGEGE
jgi:hypothetical protein